MFVKVFVLLIFLLSFDNVSNKILDTRKENHIYHKEYYNTGKPKAEGWLVNGMKSGYWIFYHPNGKISQQGEFMRNKRINYWYFYNSQGTKILEGHYQDGTKANWWLFYDQHGKVNQKCQLKKGIKDGYCLRYSNTKLISAEKYKNGKKLKEWFSFSSFRRENNLSDLK